MTKQRALRLAREWAQGHVCSLRNGEAAEYHSMFAAMLEEAPPNEPLTIEELREMGGQPVYMPDTNCWALVTQNVFCPILTFPDGEKCSVYDWYEQVGPVYLRPPEGEGNA